MRRAIIMGAAALALAAGCTKQERSGKVPSPTPSVAETEVTPTLGSVTLADDCAQAAARDDGHRGDDRERDSDAKMSGDSAARRRPACEQTTMQVTLVAGPGTQPAVVEVAKIELLDEATKAVLGELSAREPRMWNAPGGMYKAWDGHISPAAQLNVSWQLTAPDWSKLGGSRAAAAGKSFLMRVTLRINGHDTTTDKVVQSAPLMVEPEVDT